VSGSDNGGALPGLAAVLVNTFRDKQFSGDLAEGLVAENAATASTDVVADTTDEPEHQQRA